METIETIESKNFIADICFDSYPDSPREWDNLGTIVAFHSRYDLSDDDNWTKDELIEHVARQDVFSLPIYMYEHSQVSLSTTPYTCSWDSAQVGYIFVSHDEIIECYGELDLDKAKKSLKTEIEEYGQYLNGEVYGYHIYRKEDKNDCPDSLDDCWGLIGYDNAIQEVNSTLAYYEENEDE